MPELHSGVKLVSNEVNLVEDSVVSDVAAHSGTSYATHLTKTARQPVDGDWFRVTVFGQLTDADTDTKLVRVRLDDGTTTRDHEVTFAASTTGSYRAEFFIVINATNT